MTDDIVERAAGLITNAEDQAEAATAVLHVAVAAERQLWAQSSRSLHFLLTSAERTMQPFVLIKPTGNSAFCGLLS